MALTPELEKVQAFIARIYRDLGTHTEPLNFQVPENIDIEELCNFILEKCPETLKLKACSNCGGRITVARIFAT